MAWQQREGSSTQWARDGTIACPPQKTSIEAYEKSTREPVYASMDASILAYRPAAYASRAASTVASEALLRQRSRHRQRLLVCQGR